MSAEQRGRASFFAGLCETQGIRKLSDPETIPQVVEPLNAFWSYVDNLQRQDSLIHNLYQFARHNNYSSEMLSRLLIVALLDEREVFRSRVLQMLQNAPPTFTVIDKTAK